MCTSVLGGTDKVDEIYVSDEERNKHIDRMLESKQVRLW